MAPKHILIIDNGTSYLASLKHLFSEALITVMPAERVDMAVAGQFDLIVLSGGFQHEVMESDDYYAKELELIRACPAPVLGVCLGFQLIAHAFKMPVHEMLYEEKGIINIQPTHLGEKVLGSEPFKVFEWHRWVVSKTPDNFHALATSKDGIEAFRHNTLPLVGFQFHPEMFVTKSDGRKLLQTILAGLTA